MFILVEGTDNVGKSTLIKNIKDYFNDITLHALHYSNVKLPQNKAIEYSTKSYTEMFEMFLSNTSHENSGIICDRSHIGEMVYGPIYRGYSGEYVLDIEAQYKNYEQIWDKLFLITLVDSPENLISREDGLSFTVDLEKKKVEIDNFLSAQEKSLIKHKLVIDISNHNEKEALDSAVSFIRNI
jgi:thymidylate kinase